MTNEQKQLIREKWEKGFETMNYRGAVSRDAIADFWLNEIDLAIKQTEERILEKIGEIQKEMSESQISYGQDIDITELPEGLTTEMTGMKKGWQAGLEQLKATLIRNK